MKFKFHKKKQMFNFFKNNLKILNKNFITFKILNKIILKKLQNYNKTINCFNNR